MAGRAAGRVCTARSAREGGGGGGRGGSWSRARGWQDWGEGAGKGEVYLRGCLCAAIYDRQESNSMNHRELPER